MFNIFKMFTSPKKLREFGVLSMNARNHKYIAKNNPRHLYPLVDDKVQTKELAQKYKIKTPEMITKIEFQYNVKDIIETFKNYKEFVIKPAHGSGGRGIMVVVGHDGENFISSSGKKIEYKAVYKHISNILSGLYSLGGKQDVALIEELVHFSDIFKDFSYQGIPDVRIIVYKGYPVMTMMRLATKQSSGRANLHQGAVGVGLDIRTGKALNAVLQNQIVTHHPDTKACLMDLKVPFWKDLLEIGARAYDMTGLGYIGADIVLDRDKGPMVLEINARPGLAIQIANGIGLRKKLEEVDKLYPKNLSYKERVEYILR